MGIILQFAPLDNIVQYSRFRLTIMSYKHASPFEEQRVTGRDIDLPFIAALCAARANCASHIPWHVHKSHEMLFILEGANGLRVSK